MNIYLVCAVAYFSGVLLLAGIKIMIYRKKYPEEASQLKIIHTFWMTEWAAFLVSTLFLPIYLFFLYNFFDKEIYHVKVAEYVQFTSSVVGLGSQFIALELFGVTKYAVKRIVADKIREEGKQEGRDETLQKIAPADAVNITNKPSA